MMAGTLGRIAERLVGAVRPLVDAFRDSDQFQVLMLQLGWEVPGLPPSYVVVAEKSEVAVNALAALADGASVQEVLAVVDKAGAVYRAVTALTEAPDGIDAEEFLPELANRLFEYVLGRELLAEAPAGTPPWSCWASSRTRTTMRRRPVPHSAGCGSTGTRSRRSWPIRR